MAETPDSDTYALRASAVADMAAPVLDYRPPMPRDYRPRIGLIGAGGIAPSHLDAYRAAGWEVAAICSRTKGKAEALAAAWYPGARVCTDASEVFADPTIDVVDLTPHPADRLALIEAALRAGKHVLSQKPFVLDLDEGLRLADLADAQGVRLAVNQNGRWAPHMAWMRAAVQAGLIGEVISVHARVHWDHGWIAGTAFERMEDLILYDFGIHWFDFVASLVGERAQTVFATASMARGQGAKVPLLAQALIGMEGGQASLVFDGATGQGPWNATYVAGTKGSLRSEGPDLGVQQVTLSTAEGQARPVLTGQWFNDGFAGAMGALLLGIEEGREPANGARENLQSLALAFAAIRSRQSGQAVKVGSARRIAV
jgi:predicted dehydrogenase